MKGEALCYEGFDRFPFQKVSSGLWGVVDLVDGLLVLEICRFSFPMMV